MPSAPAAEPRSASERIAARFGFDLELLAPQVAAAACSAAPAGDDPAGWRQALQHLCIGETTFGRHPEQFAALLALSADLPGPAEGRGLKVWSAGCSSGEEAYTLAATLGPALGEERVLATDLNPAALERARLGRYSAWSLRGTAPDFGAGWLLRSEAGAEVAGALRARVELRELNLVVDPYPEGLDAIFCRNVLLYFHPAAVEAAYRGFASSLRPGGVLFVGPVDPLPTEGPWEARGDGRAIWLRRTAPPAQLALTAQAPTAPEPQLSLARELGARGEHQRALAELEAVLRAWPLLTEAYTLAALVAEEAGLTERALEAARRAYFLEPQQPVPAYLLALGLQRQGQAGRARELFARARAALEAAPAPDLPLPLGQGLTAAQLRRLIDVRTHG